MGISLYSQCFFCFIFILSMFCITNCFIPNAYSQCLQDQRSLLLQLRNDLRIDSTQSLKLVLWNQTQDCCNWDGVECDGAGHVISLQLDWEGISGGIHNMSSLFALRYLEKLNLAKNDFGGQIPGGIINLKHLTYLNLSGAGFGGQVPIEVSLMRRLVTLDLSYNGLEIENPNLKMLLQNLTGLRELYLDGVHMSSAVLNFFANFSHLTTLSFSDCDLRGSFPYMIFQIPTLENLDLSENELLTGSIPQFHRNASLRTMLLLHTNFSGPLPNSIGNLSMLSKISMHRCSFTGPIPSTIFTLTGLIHVDLSRNFFTGSIPSFYMSKNLQFVDLSHNSLSGSIPKSLFSLPSLQTLKLSNNQLALASCKLHNFSDLTNQHRLELLDLSNNRIIGEVPNWIWEIGNGTLAYLDLSSNLLVSLQKPYHFPSSLRYLDLHSNLLQGELPPLPQDANYIDYLSLANNSLSGAIPKSFCNATQLLVLDLSTNKLSGSISPCLVEKVEKLAVLNLWGNNISGYIPDTFSVNCRLQILDMSMNYLEGRLPMSLANCKWLQVLDVGNNNINDGFPCMLPSSLRILILRSNRFHGQVRCSRSWTDLQIIDIGSNNFTGYLYTKSFWGMMLEKDARLESENNLGISSGFEYNLGMHDKTFGFGFEYNLGTNLGTVKILTIFTVIDFSCNNFQGEIPDAIGDLRSLLVLNLSHNTFVGTIPKSLGKLTYIESVDLSTNQLTGEIPKELTRLTFLAILNLSHNQLIGPIPSGPQFRTFSTDSFQGNIGLCGFPLNISCRHAGEDDNVPPPNPHQKDEAINWDYVSVALGYVVGLGSILWLFFFSRSFKYKFNDQTEQTFQKIFNSKDRKIVHRGRTNRRRQC
ncbi:receptor-like protein 12 [Sesamum indicum]|uniref:Receptor-like protein 12 n=1 Tax=Sesamum indicum TaxID=4182 RepID=A0A8M8VB29_SESIN|nr:receptor-like protein 12 [Sesamum indicum]